MASRRRCVDCGVPVSRRAVRCRPCFHAVYWTPEAIVEAVRRWVLEHGEVPRKRDWQGLKGNGPYPSAARVQQVVGSWSAAIAAAGLEARPPAVERTRDGWVQHVQPRGRAS